MAKTPNKYTTDPTKDTQEVIQETAVTSAAEIDLDRLRAQIEAEVRAKIADELKADPGYIRPGVRTVTQEAVAETKVLSGKIPLDAHQAPPKSVTQLDSGTVRQDF